MELAINNILQALFVHVILILTCVFLGGIVIVYVRKWIAGGSCKSTSNLTGKTVVITGANSGIGKETARDFVRRGARVILACRDLSKGKRAAEDIDIDGIGEVVVRHLDLASFNSIRAFAKEILNTESKIHILINNAGCLGPKIKTKDGCDTIFCSNYLGHFLLTNLLLPRMQESAPSRIINLSAMLHRRKIHWDDLNISKSRSNYGILKAYAQSKLAMLLFTNELTRKLEGTNVQVFAVHPGLAATKLFSSLPSYIQFVSRPLLCFAKNAAQGAQTTIHCAVSNDVADQTGLYYSDCKETTPAQKALDPSCAKRLWDISVELINAESNNTLLEVL